MVFNGNEDLQIGTPQKSVKIVVPLQLYSNQLETSQSLPVALCQLNYVLSRRTAADHSKLLRRIARL